MKLTKIFVGVDVSKDNLDVCILPSKEYFKVKNNEKGLKQLQESLFGHEVVRVVCEASGGYETLLVRTLSKADYAVWLIEPKRIKAFIASEGIKAKTDKIDSFMIASFAQQKELSEQSRIKVPKTNAELLKALVQRKGTLIAIAAQEKTRLHQSLATFCGEDIQKHIKFLGEQINELEKKIDALINSDDDWKRKQEILTSIPGAGKSTAASIIAFLPELGTTGNKQAAALLGVVPYTNESGKHTKTSTIKEGRPIPRRAVYMSTLSAIQYNEDFKIFYRRLRDSGKKPKVVLIAVARKFIVLANVLLTENRIWQPLKGVYSA